MMKTGVPAACGAIPRTALTKLRKVALSLPSPLGATSILARPSSVTQSLFSESGSVSTVTRLGVQEIPHLAQRRLERDDQSLLSCVPGRRRRLRQCGEKRCEAARLRRRRGS